MIPIQIGDDGDLRCERQKGAGVFVGFDHQRAAAPRRTAAECRNVRPDQVARMQASVVQNQRGHSGGGGFAVSTGNSDNGAFAAPFAPEIVASLHGKTAFVGRNKLNVVGGQRGSHQQAIHRGQMFGAVALHNRCAFGYQRGSCRT